MNFIYKLLILSSFFLLASCYHKRPIGKSIDIALNKSTTLLPPKIIINNLYNNPTIIKITKRNFNNKLPWQFSSVVSIDYKPHLFYNLIAPNLLRGTIDNYDITLKYGTYTLFLNYMFVEDSCEYDMAKQQIRVFNSHLTTLNKRYRLKFSQNIYKFSDQVYTAGSKRQIENHFLKLITQYNTRLKNKYKTDYYALVYKDFHSPSIYYKLFNTCNYRQP